MKQPMLISSRKWLFGALALGLAAIVGVSVVVVSLNSAGAGKGNAMEPTEPITAEESKDRVRQFEGASLPDLELLPTPDSPDSSHPLNVAMLRCDGAWYGVNLDNGLVELAQYETSRSPEVKLSNNRARPIATAFAQRSRPGFSELTLIEQELFDTGASKEYSFIWAQIVDGAVTPNRIRVSVNSATGEVMGFVSRYIEIEPFAAPTMSRGTAKAVATGAFEKRTGKGLVVSDPALEVTLLPDWNQHLVWRVTVDEERESTDFINSATFFIDAHTGEILHTALAD